MGNGAKASGLALRFVLLTLLLLGVGVVHTLGHAGAHDGLAASRGVHHSSHVPPGADDEALPVLADARAADASATHPHVGPVDGKHLLDCLALVPAGSWVAAPHGVAVCGDDSGLATSRVGPSKSGADARTSRSWVLRI